MIGKGLRIGLMVLMTLAIVQVGQYRTMKLITPSLILKGKIEHRVRQGPDEFDKSLNFLQQIEQNPKWFSTFSFNMVYMFYT